MRVIVADDSALLREGLARLLAEAGHEVVAAVDDAPSLLEAVATHRPDLAVVDIRMPPTNTDDGLRAAVQIRREHAEVGVLVLSQYVEMSYAEELLAAADGAVGYLLKDRVSDLDKLARALETVAAGGTVLDHEVVEQLLARRRHADPLAALTPRERDVLRLMAEGRSNSGVGEELVLSAGAVEKHISSIFTKLGLLPAAEDHRRVLAVLAWLQAT
ncbi:response regulator [Nocardioides sp.]|uniref:response regulator transcription factor n=1 Tax=Nocardioides sp. TaxID=35761 RepID=UPI003528C45D